VTLEVQSLCLYSGCLCVSSSLRFYPWVGVCPCVVLTDIVVFDCIPFPVFTHTTGMTHFQDTELCLSTVTTFPSVCRLLHGIFHCPINSFLLCLNDSCGSSFSDNYSVYCALKFETVLLKHTK